MNVFESRLAKPQGHSVSVLQSLPAARRYPTRLSFLSVHGRTTCRSPLAPRGHPYIYQYPARSFLALFNMPPRGSEGLDFTPILTHYLFLFTAILSVVSVWSRCLEVYIDGLFRCLGGMVFGVHRASRSNC